MPARLSALGPLALLLTDFGFSDQVAAAMARISRAVYDSYNGS